jgi:hypothetical protein
MDVTVKTDHEAIANWSNILKDFALKSQEKFQKTISRLEWAVKLQEATMAVRQLEFTLTQLEFQIGKFLEIFNTLVTGRAPPSLLTPDMLHDILTNVTLNLPKGYELFMGSQYGNLPWYYEYATAALLADLHSFLLVLKLPLIAVNRNYELYKVIVFPFRVLNNTFVSYKLDDEYLAINLVHKTYVSLSEDDFNKCKGQAVRICPADSAVTDTRTENCAPSLFFQRQDAQKICQRMVFTKQPAPVLKRLGSLVVYYSPALQRADLRCRGTGTWTTDHLMLQGAGTLQGAQACHITLGDL